MRSTAIAPADPVWEITLGEMDLAVLLFEQASEIAADRGHPQLLLVDFETAVDRWPLLWRGGKRNPFRRH
jgi:hypothetical protein